MLTDPSEGLASFQQALLDGEIRLEAGRLDRAIFVHLDRPADRPRFTCARIEKNTVTALAILIPVDPIDVVPCFQLGYAVPAHCRNQVRAKDVVQAAMAELWNGLSTNGVRALWIEAIVALTTKHRNT